jgi:HAD superfamily hydrolase (TIGR01509 family)
MVKTIIFDVGEVLIHSFLGVERHLAEVSPLSEPEILERLRIPEFILFLEGKISEDGYWEAAAKKNGWDIGLASFKEAIRKNFAEVEGIRGVVDRLRAKGFRLALISDHGREWIEHCSPRFDILKGFSVIQYSFDVGALKEEPRVFQMLLGNLKEKPKDCLFIDDREVNLAAARTLGINTLHFKNSELLVKDLEKLGILSSESSD